MSYSSKWGYTPDKEAIANAQQTNSNSGGGKKKKKK